MTVSTHGQAGKPNGSESVPLPDDVVQAVGPLHRLISLPYCNYAVRMRQRTDFDDTACGHELGVGALGDDE